MFLDTRFADRTALMQRSTIREILKLTAQPNVISFAGGLPAPEYFPVERIREASEVVLSERGQEAMQYSTTEGLPELRQFLAERLSKNGLQVKLENIIILTGSQQGLDLIGRVLLNEQDRVVVENPTYLGMLLAWKPYHLEFLPIPTDQDGLCVEDVPATFAQNPKLMYSIPNFQNPSGITLNLERRQKLMELVAQNQMVVVEDDAYGELRYSGDPIPSLLQLDGGRGHVIYLGTFSKVLTPGLRLGWMVADEAVLEKVVQAKQATDLHTSTFNQLIAYLAAKDGFLDDHIQTLRNVYRERRDVMLAAMERYFPSECTWFRPDGGLFLMAHLPPQLDAVTLLQEAVQQQVAFIPGLDLFLGGVGRNTMRLNFSNSQPERIEEGIQRLGNLIKNILVR